MKLILNIVYSVILLVAIASAIEPCKDPGIRGDSNNDGILGIADAVYTLSWLFLGGSPPLCLEAVDADGDKELKLNDAIYLLTYLFQGGPAPVNPSGDPELFFSGTDDPPELGFLYIADDTTIDALLQDNELVDYIPEIPISKLPAMLSILDSSEPDIKYCIVTASSPLGEIIVFESAWEALDKLKGNDISYNPLEFIIGRGDILYDSEYLLTVRCTDIGGQTGETKIKIKIGPQPIKEPKEDTCREGIDTACLYNPTPEAGDETYLCLEDCDTNEELGVDGPYTPIGRGRCRFLENLLINGELTNEGDLVEVSTSSYNNALPEQKYGFVTESACITPDITPPATEPLSLDKSSYEFIPLTHEDDDRDYPSPKPCWVESVKIYRHKGDPNPPDFIIPRLLLNLDFQQKVPKLPFLAPDPHYPPYGPIEGWHFISISPNKGKVSSVEIVYKVGYGFAVAFKLFKGSNPDSCPEAQFVQAMVDVIQKDSKKGNFIRNIGSYMYKDEEIRKTKSLKELSLTDDVSKYLYEGIIGANAFTDMPQSQKDQFCIPGSKIWCSDDFINPRANPSYNTKTGKMDDGDLKKHIKGTEANPPYIIWVDTPGINRIKGISQFTQTDDNKNFISIVEDSHPRAPDKDGNIWRQRFRCELTGLRILTKSNGNAKPSTQFTEPSCECVSERRLEGGPNFVEGKTGEWSKISSESC